MEQSGKIKFYKNIFFYFIICFLIFIGLIVYLYNNNFELRNITYAFISIIFIILIGLSIFQKGYLKFKNKLKILSIFIILLVALFGIALSSNYYIMNKVLQTENEELYNNEIYITKEVDGVTYYFKIYSNFIKSRNASFSIKEKLIEDGDIKYRYTTITNFDNKGNVINTNTIGSYGD